MRTYSILAGVLVIATYMMAGCTSSGGGGSAPSSAVEMKAIHFNPQNLSVAKGTKVTWTNHDTVGHTVTSDESGGPLASTTVQPGQTYTYTFSTAGTFHYHCKPHSSPNSAGSGFTGMTGTVTVS